MHIEIDIEEMTRIVCESLMHDYDNVGDDPDFPGLQDAIKKVLEYYSDPSQYDKWLESKGITR